MKRASSLSRRDFLASAFRGVCMVGGLNLLHEWAWADEAVSGDGDPYTKEVMFYRKLESGAVECEICPRHCNVDAGERGYCGNKENRKGTYYTLVYNRVCAAHTDPIEKKPLFHYLPGTTAFSIAAAGCNLHCKFCQNWTIAQRTPEDVLHQPLTSEDAVAVCRRAQSPTIAFTYSEPTVFYTYMYDVAQRARRAGVGSVMISNGFMEEKPLRALCKQLTGVKIDLKSFDEEFYDKYCSAELKPVLATLQRLRNIGIWFEIVNLVIPTLNDDPQQLRDMCEWIKVELGPDVPVHFTRFHPMYQIKNLPPTPVKTLERARAIALEAGLHYPYVGNVWGHEGEHTYCPACKKLIIRRTGYMITENWVVDGTCTFCKQPIPGVWTVGQLGL